MLRRSFFTAVASAVGACLGLGKSRDVVLRPDWEANVVSVLGLTYLSPGVPEPIATAIVAFCRRIETAVKNGQEVAGHEQIGVIHGKDAQGFSTAAWDGSAVLTIRILAPGVKQEMTKKYGKLS